MNVHTSRATQMLFACDSGGGCLYVGNDMYACAAFTVVDGLKQAKAGRVCLVGVGPSSVLDVLPVEKA